MKKIMALAMILIVSVSSGCALMVGKQEIRVPDNCQSKTPSDVAVDRALKKLMEMEKKAIEDRKNITGFNI